VHVIGNPVIGTIKWSCTFLRFGRRSLSVADGITAIKYCSRWYIRIAVQVHLNSATFILLFFNKYKDGNNHIVSELKNNKLRNATNYVNRHHRKMPKNTHLSRKSYLGTSSRHRRLLRTDATAATSDYRMSLQPRLAVTGSSSVNIITIAPIGNHHHHHRLVPKDTIRAIPTCPRTIFSPCSNTQRNCSESAYYIIYYDLYRMHIKKKRQLFRL